jgi:WD40 repeat protein/uncharacterized caspase-like protein
MLALLAGVLLATKGWGAEAAAPILQIESGGHTANCKWVGFTPDGRQLVSAGHDKVVRVWDLGGVIEAFQRADARPTNAALPKIPLVRSLRLQIGPGDEGKIYAGAISPKPLPSGGWLLAVGGYGTLDNEEHGGDIRLLDLASGHVLGLLRGHSDVVQSLAFSPDGKLLASGSGDEAVRVWDLGAGAGDWSKAEDGTLKVPCQVLEGHTDSVYGLTFVPGSDGQATLASGSLDKTIRLWRRDRSGRWGSQAPLTGHTAVVVRVAASPDGRTLASASFDRSVRLWDARNGKFLRVLGEIGVSVDMIAFMPDGQALVAAADNRVYDGSRVLRVPQGGVIARFNEHDNTVFSVAVAKVAPASSDAGRNSRGGGTLVASAGGDNNDIFLWDAATGRTLGHIVGAGHAVWAVALSPDARWLAWGNVNEGGAFTFTNRLRHVFDLSDMQPGRQAVTNGDWQRALLTQAGWSAERPEAAQNTLIIRRDGREASKVVRSFSYDNINCYSFVPNGGLIVASSFRLTLNDPATGKELREFVGHTSEILTVAVSPDGRLLVSGSSDQTFRLWNIATGELLLSVFVSYGPDGSVGEWVAWTPAGYYKSSPGGDKLIGWHLNRGPDKAADFVVAWQMRKLFEKPEVVEHVLSELNVSNAVSKYLAQSAQAAEKPLDIQKTPERFLPPTVTIYEPKNNTRSEADKVAVIARAFQNGSSRITRVDVYVDGRQPGGLAAPKLPPADGAGQSQLIEVEVPLKPGTNLIEVQATAGDVSSLPARVEVVREAPLKRPACFFLGVGVNKTEGGLKLGFAAADVEAIAAALKRQEGVFFDRVECRLVLNTNATLAGIQRGMEWLKSVAKQGSVAVILVSSHGWPEAENDLYLCPFDFDPDVPGAFGWAHFDLARRASQVDSQVLLLLDACHSGRVLRETSQMIQEFRIGGSRLAVVASSLDSEDSFEVEGLGHGAFTLAVIEALTGQRQTEGKDPVLADANGNGELDVSELGTYLMRRVPELSGTNQHPIYYLGSSPFGVAKVSKWKRSAPQLAGLSPKGPSDVSFSIPLADLASTFRESPARIKELALYGQTLTNHFGGKGTVVPAKAGKLEFEVTGLRGVITGERDRWEQITVSFTAVLTDREVAIQSIAWGKHVVAAFRNQPPEPRAFSKDLGVDFPDRLRREHDLMLRELEDRLRGNPTQNPDRTEAP